MVLTYNTHRCLKDMKQHFNTYTKLETARLPNLCSLWLKPIGSLLVLHIEYTCTNIRSLVSSQCYKMLAPTLLILLCFSTIYQSHYSFASILSLWQYYYKFRSNITFSSILTYDITCVLCLSV